MRRPSHSVSFHPNPGRGEIVVLFSGEEQTLPNHHVGPQMLDYFLVHHIVSGKGRYSCMGREYELSAGDSFFIFPGHLVSYASDPEDPWHYLWVGFGGSAASQLLSRLDLSIHRPAAKLGPNRRTPVLFRLIKQSLGLPGAKCDLTTEGYMRLLLAEFANGRAGTDADMSEPTSDIHRKVEQAIHWLTLQYSQPISIEQMAHTLGYHRTHLSKMFKQRTGVSPFTYLQKIRMERARLLLQQPLTIEQIASSVGIADPLYFSKLFKKWHGCSPTEYRQTVQGKQRYDRLHVKN